MKDNKPKKPEKVKSNIYIESSIAIELTRLGNGRISWGIVKLYEFYKLHNNKKNSKKKSD